MKQNGDRRLELLSALERLRAEMGYSPSYHELKQALGWSSTDVVWRWAWRLFVEGCVAIDYGRARTARLTEKGRRTLLAGQKPAAGGQG